jgi:hypothetical protein
MIDLDGVVAKSLHQGRDRPRALDSAFARDTIHQGLDLDRRRPQSYANRPGRLASEHRVGAVDSALGRSDPE